MGAIGLAVFYGPAWFRDDADKEDALWNAIAFVVPLAVADFVHDHRAVNQGNLEVNIVARICLYVQIAQSLLGSPYLSFAGDDSLGDRLQDAFDWVMGFLPQPAGSKSRAKAATPKKPAAR